MVLTLETIVKTLVETRKTGTGGGRDLRGMEVPEFSEIPPWAAIWKMGVS